MTLRRENFGELAAPFRAELLAHCYQMTGSLHDAEDAVQETLLRAWRSFDAFEQRSSLRTWLHRIATNTCLNAVQRGPARRVLPAGLGAPSEHPELPLLRGGREVAWLQPLPDRALTQHAADPSMAVLSRERIRLAFVAALQMLPARQRAVLILRDVLALPANDVAAMLGSTTAAVNGALRRARATMARDSSEREVGEPDDPETRVVVDRYVAAFEAADIAALTDLLVADAHVQMPPFLTWFRGRDRIVAFFAGQVRRPGEVRMVRTRANGQPAVATYLRSEDGRYRPNSVHVLTVRAGLIHDIVAFIDPELFATFDLSVD